MHIVRLEKGRLINMDAVLYVVPADGGYKVVFSSGLEGHAKGFFSDKSTYAESASIIIDVDEHFKLMNALRKNGFLYE